MSLMLCQVAAPGEIGRSAGSVVRAVREAFPAQGAVVAALLARDGVAGFEQPLEGNNAFFRLYAGGRYEAAEILDGLGEVNLTEELSFKPWASCRGTHAYIQAALELARGHRLSVADIKGVSVQTGPVQSMLIEPLEKKRMPETAIDAKFSIPFTVALALVRGRVSPGDFDDAARSDRDVLRLAGLVRPVPQHGWGDSDATRGALSIELEDGRTLSGEVDVPYGSPSDPISDEALVEKFVDCCAHAARPLGAGAARTMANRILAIDQAEDSGSCFERVGFPQRMSGPVV